MPTSQFVDGVQWHALAPLDLSFTSRIPDPSAAQLRYLGQNVFRPTEPNTH